MIKKLFTKYFLEVIPSIVATVVGAYIVTHYINAKTEADKPKAAVAAPADTAKDAPQTLKADEAGDRPATAAKAEAARLKAEKLAAEKAAAERAAADRAENAKRAAEKAAEKLAAEKAASEKAVAEKPAAEKRDASDLARAAIERLRKSSPQSAEQPRAADVPQGQERARVNSVVYAPAAQQPAVQPLPPAVNVAPQPSEAVAASPAPFPRPIDSADSREDSLRLTPPADIPARPVDLTAKQRRSVTEDVVSAAKSVFHAVVPESSN